MYIKNITIIIISIISYYLYNVCNVNTVRSWGLNDFNLQMLFATISTFKWNLWRESRIRLKIKIDRPAGRHTFLIRFLTSWTDQLVQKR